MTEKNKTKQTSVYPDIEKYAEAKAFMNLDGKQVKDIFNEALDEYIEEQRGEVGEEMETYIEKMKEKYIQDWT